MPRSNYGFSFAVTLTSLVLGQMVPGPFLAQPALAQVTADTTLPNPSSVQTSDNTWTIRGGTQPAGSNNLFHSFSEFSIPSGRTAVFQNAIDIQNIFARVTGRSVSTLDGTIRANGLANLFLLNPNGIILGPNAQISIGGSFVASTANSIRFADQFEFRAANEPTPLLTVSAPIGLQFGPNPAPITVNHNPPTSLLDPGLLAPTGQTFALVGGDIIFNGGRVTSLSGRVELAALAEAGTVGLNAFDRLNPITFSPPDGILRGDVRLTNQARIYASAPAPQTSITIHAHNIDLSGDSSLIAPITGFSPPGFQSGDIDLDATNRITVDNSNIFPIVLEGGKGIAGSLNITTRSLLVTGNARIGAVSQGQGSAGDVRIKAETITVDGTGSRLLEASATGIYTYLYEGAIGNAGNLVIRTQDLSLVNGGQISASTDGRGNAGTVDITATGTVLVDGATPGPVGIVSGITSGVEVGATGNGGRITITAPTLRLNQGGAVTGRTRGQGDGGDITLNLERLEAYSGGQVSSTSQAAGDAGDITLNVDDRILLTGRDQTYETRTAAFGDFSSYGGSESGIYANSAPTTTGAGGSILIPDTNQIILEAGGQISVSSQGTGDAGNITINADSLHLSGISGDNITPTRIAATTSRAGQGGNIGLELGQLQVREGAQITADTAGAGDAGSITVNARDSIVVSGQSGEFSSRLSTTVQPGATGQGGDLTVTADRLRIVEGGLIRTGTASSGDSGNLTVRANQIDLVGGSANRPGGFSPTSASGLSTTVQTPFATGRGGHVFVQADRLAIRQGAQINVSTSGIGDAGNVTVRADQIRISGATDRIPSAILAIAELGSQGNGGTVRVTGRQIRLSDSGQFTAVTGGAGNAGNMVVRADDIAISGNNSVASFNVTGLFTSAAPMARGRGGDVMIRSDRLRLQNTSILASGTFGEGNSGDIDIQVRQLDLQTGSSITSSSSGLGNAGDLNIRADRIRIDGSNPSGMSSGLYSSVEMTIFPAPGGGFRVLPAAGDGGDIRVESDRLEIWNGGEISASTYGNGDAGDVIVNAQSINVAGVATHRFENAAPTRSSINAGAFPPRRQIANSGRFTGVDLDVVTTGSAGSVTVNAETLQVRDRANLSVSNTNRSGNAGNLTINANTVRLDQQSSLQAEVSAGNQGNLRVNADVVLLDRQSQISTNAQGTATGGNIRLNTNYLFALNNSDITANAIDSFGGQVSIGSQAIVSTEFRPSLTSDSDITASSERGADFSGTVQLQTPNVQPGDGVMELPETVIDPNTQVANACEATTENTFVLTGRGGLPASPTRTGGSDRAWADLRDLSSFPEQLAQGQPTTQTVTGQPAPSQASTTTASSSSIQEASGWTVNNNGQVELVALNGSTGALPAPDCAAHQVSYR